MKKMTGCLALVVLLSPHVDAQDPVVFADVFVDSTMRIDYFHTANAYEEEITLDKIYRQGPWAGNPHTLIDPFNNGRYRTKVIEVSSNRILYTNASTGFCAEYKTTDPAGEGVRRTFHESSLIPYPRRRILFVIEKRDSHNVFQPLFSTIIDPSDYHINTESPSHRDVIVQAVRNGDPHSCVDLVILGDGYTTDETSKFTSDVRRFSDVLLSFEPYKRYKERFNITGVLRPSAESGVDQPRQGIYRNTTLQTTFNSMDSDRYLLTEDNKDMRDIASSVPYDALLVMVNSTRYGGGALTNVFTAFTSDGPWDEFVFLHEFGHGFGGLADEYYTTDVAYNEFFPPGVEPTEPNITALLDPANLKWKQFVSPGLSIPTEWGQTYFDSLRAAKDTLTQEKARVLLALGQAHAPDAVVKDTSASFDKKSQVIDGQIRDFVLHHPLRGKIGAFEGGGFVPKGLYRPTVNSLMHMFYAEEKTYYRVNEEAIIRVIKRYTE